MRKKIERQTWERMREWCCAIRCSLREGCERKLCVAQRYKECTFEGCPLMAHKARRAAEGWLRSPAASERS